MFNENQFTLWFEGEFQMSEKSLTFKDIIVDRKSKYTIVGFFVDDEKDIKKYLKALKEDPYFRKATHNSYAYRIKQESGSIIEWKNDDGETGAGLCILREIQRENGINILLVVTRYFWGIKLQADRFKNVIDACKMFFEKVKK